jgi:uncharacterized protein
MMQSIYLDSSIIVSIILKEPTSHIILERLETILAPCMISDFAILEFHDAIGRRAREIPRLALLQDQFVSDLSRWIDDNANRESMEGSDISDAIMLLRIAQPQLRAQDAIHIAAARRLSCRLFTLDQGMQEAALRLNLAVVR